MLASRLLSILMLLQTRGRMSATELAGQFEVSVRTIYRDIDQLSAAGVPVFADRGRSGGFQLLDGYRTKLTGLTQSEAETLFLAGLPGPAAQLGLAEILATARLKLMAALPANVQPQAERIAARFHLDPTAWFRGADPLPSLQVVARAVWSGHYLNLRYRRAGQSDVQPHKLGPLGLVLKGGIWYLVARSRNSIRTYRASNIHDAEISDEVFPRPAEFDLAGYWKKASRDYEVGIYREQADVRLSPDGLARLDLLGPYATEAAAKSAGKPDRRGWVRCSLPIESIEYGVRELMRLGDDVEVIGPLPLRARMTATLEAMSKRYKSAS
ncbi:MAG: YafY family protein [Rhizomicrobium sp.]|jgi:predicted DNA-binding transcriptional regulator YafY